MNKNNNYKVGDTVVLTSKRPITWSSKGSMDNYLGQTVTITEIDNGYFWFDGSEPWSFLLDDIDRKISSKGSKHMSMEDKVEKVANYLLKANNTVTTLEIKVELRNRWNKDVWNQSYVSSIMQDLANKGKFNYTDNGTYRVYSHVSKTISKSKSKSKSIPIPAVPNKRQRISKTKAIELLNNTKGRFFGVTFTKKDGTERSMRCRVEGNLKISPLGYATLKDVSEDKPKSVNLQTLSEIRLNKITYLVN
jgi:hypothetical protein